MHEYFDHEEVRKFFKGLTIAVVLLSVFLLGKTLTAFKDWREPSASYNTIVVTGEGEAFATPDIASFSFSVSADAKSVADAQATVTTKTNAILNALKVLGVDAKDIRTTDYSVYPKYTYEQAICSPGYCPPSRQIPDGYTVTHSLSVKVRETDNAGEALAIAGEKGATDISSLAFTVDNPDEVTAEARDKAIQDAKAKAKSMAKSLDVRLGRVVEYNENSGGYYPYKIEMQTANGSTRDSARAVPSLEPGQNKVVINASITYEVR